MDTRTDLKILGALIVSLATLLGACEGWSRSTTSLEVAPVEQTPQLPWVEPEALDLQDPSAFTEHRLRLAESVNYPECHTLFEPEGEPVDWPWLMDGSKQAMAIFGCEPEGYERTEEGRRYVAYGVPMEGSERARNLRLVAYDAAGKVRWARMMDRSANRETFTANLRSSFIALLEPRHACAGSLWQGGTQLICVDEESGDVIYSGMLSFWSGIELQGRNESLYGADINGLTRRYPFSGIEMRHRPVHGTGGRAAFYGHTKDALFFAPSSDGTVSLGKYGFDDMKTHWLLDLPARPLVSWRYGFDEHQRLLFKIGETVYAIDTESGAVVWAIEIGKDLPPVAASPEAIYLLLRRETQANLLYAIEPKTGQVLWYAPTPTGTLGVGWLEGSLMLRSVRAVREVLHHAPAAPRVPDDQ